MKNYLFYVTYNGSDFCGWAPQPKKHSVTDEICNAFNQILKVKIKINGSGRTDAGVHAIEQTFTTKLDTKIPLNALIDLVNKKMNGSVQITKAKVVSDDFHARFSATQKHYRYVISMQDINVFENRLKWCVKEKLNSSKMKEASKYLIGTHDFTSYCSNVEGEKLDHIRTIHSLVIKKQNNDIVFDIKGNGFLRHMVRKIVGTLKVVGEGKIDPTVVKDILDKKDQKYGVYKAEPSGLYLVKVKY